MSVLASERLIVPISSQDKQRVEARAREIGVSTAEYVRRSLQNFDPAAAGARQKREEEEQELALLLEALHTSRAATLAQLDRTEAALDTALAYFAEKKAAAEQTAA
ncbi:hypothetical protein FHS82_002001 [Pseudochelatococcus lubricantis]|uniref:Ribbon-helix-helix protein CopG domain-containing protein n=1 Tax=Pseudochelatococcus lubricantis TaxID=1538102 RepID=A0ABX0UYX8_9HYPH|nr:hypothetical protein [Pseudochelatococcus lubricantis]NIJ58159.1 hypothetical protein [Pseudochelatococcus lubricantis]